jgi:hypothetical protein
VENGIFDILHLTEVLVGNSLEVVLGWIMPWGLMAASKEVVRLTIVSLAHTQLAKHPYYIPSGILTLFPGFLPNLRAQVGAEAAHGDLYFHCLRTAFTHLKEVSKDCLTGNMYIRRRFPWPKNPRVISHLPYLI